MKTKKRLIVVALIFLVVGLLKGSILAYDVAEYFPLNQGDEWIGLRKLNLAKLVVNGTELIDGVETVKRDASLVLRGAVGSDCHAVDSEGVKFYRSYFTGANLVVTYDPPLLIIPYLEEGEFYAESVTASDHSIDDGAFLKSYTVIHMVSLATVENVKVLAGTFEDCLKFYESYTYLYDDGATVKTYSYITWYARNVGMVKSYEWVAENDKFIGNSVVRLLMATVDGIDYGLGSRR